MSPKFRICVALVALAGWTQLGAALAAQLNEAPPVDPWAQHEPAATPRYAERDDRYPQQQQQQQYPTAAFAQDDEPGRAAAPQQQLPGPGESESPRRLPRNAGPMKPLIRFEEKIRPRSRQQPIRAAAATEQTAAEASAESSHVDASNSPDSSAQRPVRLAPQREDKPLALAPRDQSGRKPARGTDTFSSLMTMGASLAVVVGLFLVTSWVVRRGMPKSLAMLPSDVVEVLGRTPLAARQQMHLVRCGNKLLLVCATPGGIETLTEITDPVEVDRLKGLCQQGHSGSATKAFQHVLNQFGAEKPTSEFAKQQYRDRLDLSSFASIGGGSNRKGADG